MKHVKVRIAVAVSPRGEWWAYGSDSESAAVAKSWALEGSETDDSSVVWVVAHVPIPSEPSVEGKVES